MLQNRTRHHRFGAGVATLVAVAMVGTAMSDSAVAADRTQEKASQAPVSAAALQSLQDAVIRIKARESTVDTASSSFRSGDLSGVSDEKGMAALQQAFDLIASIPESLIQRVETGDQGAAQEIADFLNQGSTAAPATRGWFQCAAGLAKFAAENAIGIAKAYKIVKGGKKVIKAAWDYIKHKKRPAGIDEDIANLIVNSTGLPALAEACL
ncbi:hypothetical protein [Streptomyces sp. MNP-20]|uniref:hypothetical protein n=1 Tax=Streptomyces sp. MNP-20 TaxID=2721165 RepID=UPI001551EF26|nr:hypothetical protein [Streptomyces sp. MNP-20]